MYRSLGQKHPLLWWGLETFHPKMKRLIFRYNFILFGPSWAYSEIDSIQFLPLYNLIKIVFCETECKINFLHCYRRGSSNLQSLGGVKYLGQLLSSNVYQGCQVYGFIRSPTCVPTDFWSIQKFCTNLEGIRLIFQIRFFENRFLEF